ncbi:DAK2 domain-containing protein, partial [Clostridium perfringens]|nr:DAK2 domain-containing protein [Clostridium perfringens]
IKKVGTSYCDVALEILSDMIDEDSELITIFYGSDVTEEEAEEFAERVENKYEDLDVQCYRGAQPLYYFLMSAE